MRLRWMCDVLDFGTRGVGRAVPVGASRWMDGDEKREVGEMSLAYEVPLCL